LAIQPGGVLRTMNGNRIPLEVVRGADEVTVWLYPDRPRAGDTMRFSVHEWAKIERYAKKETDGDLERAFADMIKKWIKG